MVKSNFLLSAVIYAAENISTISSKKLINEEMKNFKKGLAIGNEGSKTINYIDAPKGASYLSDFMDKLPYGILNKKEPGCGATTVALENVEDVIICCPTRQLIINKTCQYPNGRCQYKILGVMSGVGQDEIRHYIDRCKGQQPVKLMVTYDAFPRVHTLLKQTGMDFHIIVDEYQEILAACIYRNSAIRKLLSELEHLPKVTYLSATPIRYGFVPDELSSLPQYEIRWSNTMRVKPFTIKAKNPMSLVVNMIRNHKAGKPMVIGKYEVKEYFFFVNSVKTIGYIIEEAALTQDEVKIICADTGQNRVKLNGFKIENATGANRTFTFCTKTVFLGADFHSDAGLAVIVSDGNAESSLLDVSTDIVQIAGRIRTKSNPFRYLILHIYNEKTFDEKAQYEGKIRERLKYAEDTITAFNTLPPNLKDTITLRLNSDDPEEFVCYDEKSGTIKVDRLKVSYVKYKYEAIYEIYSNGLSLRDAYIKVGFDANITQELEQIIKRSVYFGLAGNEFQRYYDIYSEERRKNMVKTSLMEQIEQQYPLVREAYYYLGDEKVKKLR